MRPPIDSTLASLCGPRHAGGVELVAQRGAHAGHLVGRELLALSAAADDDAALGVALDDGPADERAEQG